MKSISHIINPVNIGPKSDLHVAQPVTFESFRRAIVYSNNQNITQYTVQFKEDNKIIPEYFTVLPDLTRNVADVAEFNQRRPLPLIKDILQALYNHSKAEYCIYSNVDIAIQPFFYDFILNKINEGFDAFVINRRTVSCTYNEPDDLTSLYSQSGSSHPGYDCFVFRTDYIPHFVLGNICIGANHIGKVLIANMIALAKNFRLFDDQHLTFHIGDDQVWKKKSNNEFEAHNARETVSILKHLLEEHQLSALEAQAIESMLANTMTNSNIPLTKYRYFPRTYPVLKNLSAAKWLEPLRVHKLKKVFITGMPRSGTTFLQSLMSTQNEVLSLPETHLYTYLVSDFGVNEFGSIEEKYIPVISQRITEKLGFQISFHAMGFLKDMSGNNLLTLRTLFDVVISEYIREKSIGLDGFNFLVEKTPSHILEIEKIMNDFPDAKFVHIIRNPFKAISSYEENLSTEYPKTRRELCLLWNQCNRIATHYNKRYPHNVMIVRYEDLVDNRINVMKEVCQFIGVTYNAEALDDFAEKSVNYIMSFEKWKEGNSSKQYKQNRRTKLTLEEQFKMQVLMEEQMKKHDYSPRGGIVYLLFKRLQNRLFKNRI